MAVDFSTDGQPDPPRDRERGTREATAASIDTTDRKRQAANTMWLDRGYDSAVTRERLSERGITDAIIARNRKRGAGETKKNQPMGLRWPVERTNSWLSNFGQLRRNTDRSTRHRLAQFALAVTCLLAAKLIDWRNRWSPTPSPIR